MKDDPEFNIYFVGLIERNPCVYDHTSSDYSKKNVQDRAWETISKEISEPIEDCKDRWKNLRACFTRHLKSLVAPSRSGARTKRPYYLAEHLHFLQPFTKSRKSHDNISSPQSVMLSPESVQIKEEHDVVDNSDEEPEDTQTEQDISTNVASLPPEDNSFNTPPTKRQRKNPKYLLSIAEVNKSAIAYFDSMNTSNTEVKGDDPDLAFLKSVQPDMKEMNNDQKRRFKIGILHLAGRILNEYTAAPVLSASPSSSDYDVIP